MCCITLGGLLCSVGLARLSLEGTNRPLLRVRLPPLRRGRFSWVMTHQAPALALVTVPLCPVFVWGCERKLSPCLPA
jgi:hypothetical protein